MRFDISAYPELGSIRSWGVQAGLPAPGESDWLLRDEPSVSGDIAQIDVLGLPEIGGYMAAYFEIAIDDGRGGAARLERLLMGPATRYVRHLRLTPAVTSAVILRVIWIEESSGFEIAGQWTDPKPVTPTLGDPVVLIAASRGSASQAPVAPAGIQFRAIGLGFGVLRPFHQLRYRWIFPETGDWDRLDGDHPWSRERSVAFGPVAGFTFETPGPKVVTCEVTDGVRTVSRRVEVMVGDPDQVFSGGKTHIVSSRGDWLGAPPGAIGHRSIGAAIDAARRQRDVRILLRRGERFDSVGTMEGFERVQIGAYGEGRDPLLSVAVGGREVTQEMTVWGLSFDGGYDPSRIGPQLRPENGLPLSKLRCHVTMHSCTLRGMDITLRPAGPGGTTVVTNVRASEWHDYGMLGGDVGALSMAGVSILQHSRALFQASGVAHKGEKGPPLVADHGPLRLSRPTGPISLDNCHMFTNSDWTRPQAAVQPIYRINTDGVFPMTVVLSRQRCEGGQLSFGSDNPNKRNSPGDILIDKMIHVATKSGNQLLRMRHGGATVRNAVLVMDDVPTEAPRAISGFLNIGAPESGSRSYVNDAAANPIEIYNLTMVDLRRPRHMVGNNGQDYEMAIVRFDKDRPDVVTIDNIVEYRPNAASPFVADGPLDTRPGPMPLYAGRRAFREVEYTYHDANGRLEIREELIGSNSRAIGRVIAQDEPQLGSFRGGDAQGMIVLQTLTGTFQPGDKIRVNDATLVLGELTTVPGTAMIRFANTRAATARFAPLDGSSAIGSADLERPVAIDDLMGNIRPGFDGGPAGRPSRGALEPD